ncbi:MAG TPA: discoidin domain-containing protein [Epulopiscium sp.]|nr:discoidin domain-containing protein [Candidatus Epulonipiscium sp.]
MKKMISLIISASIFLQMVVPVASTVTYAQTGDLYGLKWEQGKSLSRGLVVNDIKIGEQEALVSWKVGGAAGSYILEYFVEDEDGLGGAERVELTFKREDLGNTATVDVKVFDESEEIDKVYQRFNMDTGNWIEMSNDEVIPLQKGSTYPGGSILVGPKMEIRFRWSDTDTVYVQTNNIKQGNITPFELKNEDLKVNQSDKIEVLAGLEEYKISPIHIEIENGEMIEKREILNKDTIEMPGVEHEHPGSSPGIKVEFKRPRSFDKDSDEFKFEEIDSDVAKNLEANLNIIDLTDVSALLSFSLEENSTITGLDNEEKKLLYDKENSTYILYLAEDDMGDENIVKWEALQASSIFKVVDLALKKKDENQSLGLFSPIAKGKDDDIGRYTYLKYKIERSSLQDAYIEVEPYRGTETTEFTYAVEVSMDNATWTTLVEHKYMPTSIDDNTPIRIPVPFAATDDNRYYRITVQYSQGTMYSQKLHYKPKEDLTIPPPTPNIQSIDNIYAVPPEKLGDQPATIGFDLTWSAPRNSSQDRILDGLLDKGNIYYELWLHQEAEASKDTGALIKVFKVSAHSTGEDTLINVDPYAGTAGKNLKEKRYNPSRNTFTMENVVLKNQGQDGWEQIINMPDDYDENKEKYPELDLDNVDNKLVDKEVPGIYYLTMRALYEPEITTGSAIVMGISNESNPKPITISPLEEVIPVPTKIESNNLLDEVSLNRIRQSFSWGNVDLARYIKQMLDPLNLSIRDNNQGVYQVYLYQKNQKKNIEESDLVNTTPSAINLHMTKEYPLEEDIEVLRRGGAIRLDYDGSTSTGMNNIVLEGLDANQVYYSKIRVRLDLQDNDGKPLDPRYSVFSKEHSFTTYTKPSEPEPGERVPPVPEALTIIDQPNNTTASIGWKAPDYSKQEG